MSESELNNNGGELELRLGLRNEDGARFWRKKYVTAAILWFLNARDQL